MKRNSLAILAGLLISFLSFAADEVKPQLILDHLVVSHTQEKLGDELYFDIAIYRPKHEVKYMRVPATPYYWSSKSIKKASNAQLWSERLAKDEAISILLSLVESDGSPMNPDDVVGFIRVDMKNQNGVLQSTWNLPNQKASPVAKDKPQQFTLESKGGFQYQVFLSLKN